MSAPKIVAEKKDLLERMKARLAEIRPIVDQGIEYMAMDKAATKRSKTARSSAFAEVQAFLSQHQAVVDEGIELLAMIKAGEEWRPPSLLPLSMDSGDVLAGEKKTFSLSLPIPFALLEFSFGPANVEKFDVLSFRSGLWEMVGVARDPTAASEFVKHYVLANPVTSGPGCGPYAEVRNISKKTSNLRITCYGFDLTTRQGAAWMERRNA